MTPLPAEVTDSELIAFIDRWAALLEREDYEAAFAFTDHIPEMKWTPALVRELIKSCGDAEPDQRVTVEGVPTDITQRKRVDRWPTNAHGCFGEVRYDLNIDGKASDLTATFALVWTDGGVTVHLDDIHVM
ncbi:MAG TPA: hypothetical protein VIC28_11045 [Thermoanaerobaculia bacterium]|jgi:hypothetical protein